MFFPERLRSIRPTDKVLEVGPGSLAHPRADVFLDRLFEDEAVACAHRGGAPKVSYDRGVIYYPGGIFPFKDKAFDYLVCAHVLEHVPAQELSLFLSEIERVAGRGYLEFPSIFYELINHNPVHHWMMNCRQGTIYLMPKTAFKSNFVHKAFREMFYGADRYMYKAFGRYREFFFCGFEWNGPIRYQVVEDYDQLVNQEDYERLTEYFKTFRPRPRKPRLAAKAAEAGELLKDGLARMWRRLFKGKGHPNKGSLESWQACDGEATLRLDYDLSPQSVVIDVGGRRGEWARQMVQRYDPTVYILAAAPELGVDLSSKFSANPKVKVFGLGLPDRDGTQPIALDEDGTGPSRKGGRGRRVQTREIAGFLAEHGLESVDLIKINVEGSEYQLLRRMIETCAVARCRDIQVRFHRLVPEATQLRDEIRKLLAQTHYLTYDFPFICENWRRRAPACSGS